MIKSLHLLLYILIFSFSAQAQVEISPVNVRAEGDVDASFEAIAIVKNTSDQTITLKVEKALDNLRDNWYSSFKVENDELSPITESFNLKLASGESRKVGIIFYPEGSEGSSSVDVMFKVTTPGITSVHSQTFVGKTRTKTNTSDEDFRIYPNPATTYFKVSSSQSIKRIEVYNIIGKKLKEFTSYTVDQQFKIHDLSRGIYLVRLLDNNDKVVDTKRLNIVIP